MKPIITTIFAIALSFSVYAQQSDTMFVHQGQTVYEFPTSQVDSIIFYRTGASTPPSQPSTMLVESVSLSQTAATIGVGDTLRLSANVFPANASNKNLLWFSNSPAIAKVVSIQEGIIVGNVGGTAEIAVVSGCGGKVDVCRITVGQAVNSVHINWANYPGDDLWIGDTFTFTAVVLPLFASNKAVTWSSSNPEVATITENGFVTAISVGETEITVTTQDGNKMDRWELWVHNHIELSDTLVMLFLDRWENFTLYAGINSYHIYDITWSSNNPTVATIGYDDGNRTHVWASGLGTAIISVTAVTERGTFSASCTIIVTLSCYHLEPGFADLGTITLGGERTISGNGITQIWSDAVTATGCNKETFIFDDSSQPYLIADCRSNPGYPGDLFNWCAVARFADKLCPYPWRVPTQQDFVNLDIALGGTGQNRYGATGQLVWYTGTDANQWGGAYGGLVRDGLFNQGIKAHYWSSTVFESTGSHLSFGSVDGAIFPFEGSTRSLGYSLRCIRDN